MQIVPSQELIDRMIVLGYPAENGFHVEEMVEWLRSRVWVKIYADFLTQTIEAENPNYKYSPSECLKSMLFNSDTLSNAVAQAVIWVLE